MAYLMDGKKGETMRRLFVAGIIIICIFIGLMLCNKPEEEEPYSRFIAGKCITNKGLNFYDYVGERTENRYYFIHNQNAEDEALVVWCNTAESKYAVIHYENGVFVEKFTYGKEASGATFLYDDSYLVWNGEAGCGCRFMTIWEMNRDYELDYLSTFCVSHVEECLEEGEVILPEGDKELEEIVIRAAGVD